MLVLLPAAGILSIEAAGTCCPLLPPTCCILTPPTLQDLETRKRAPLYQKRQEEELKAAVEKAQECDIRATEAELRAKEARVGLGVGLLSHLLSATVLLGSGKPHDAVRAQ